MVRRSAILTRGLVLALTGAIASSAGAATGEPELPRSKDRWFRVETANFTIYSNAAEELARSAGAGLEQLRAVLRTLFGGVTLVSPVPTSIYVFDDAKSFAPYTLYYQGRAKDQVAGYFGAGRYGNHVAIVAGLHSSDVSATINHEYIHYVLHTNHPGLPLWLDEGLAEFYSTFRVEHGVAKIGLPVGSHVQWLREHALIPIDELIAVDHGSPVYNEGIRRGSFYAQCWALTHLLVIGQPDTARRTATYTGMLRDGVDRDEAFFAAFETTGKELEAKLRWYIGNNRMTFINLPLADPTTTEARISTMAYPEVLYRLGDLLTSLGPERHATAAAHFNAALELDPTSGPALAGLGRIDELAGRPDGALARYRRAAELAPDDFMVQFLLGNRLVQVLSEPGAGDQRAALADEATTALKRAVVLEPTFGEAWAALGVAAISRDSDDEMSMKALEHASRLLPGRGDVGANLVVACLNLGRTDEARAAVGRMRAAGVDHEMVAAAERLIASRTPPATSTQTAAAPPTEAEPVTTDRSPGFTERYNEAVAMVNAGRLEAAIAALEELAASALQPREAEAATSLLAQVRGFAAFRSRADEAARLASSGEFEAAIAILEPLVAQAPDEAQTAEIERMLGRLRSYRDFQQTYNRAVDLFNSGRTDAAAELLEPLVGRAPTQQLAAMAAALLDEIKEMR